MNKYLILIIAGFLGLFSNGQAQTSRLKATFGLGYGRFITDMSLSGLNKNGYSGMLRIMWQPEHLLRVGLETGYYRLYTFDRDNIQTDFGSADAHSTLAAIPIHLNWAMRIIPGVELFAGIGETVLNTRFSSFGAEARSTQLTTSYTVGGTYSTAVTENIALGGELKYYRINKIEDGTLTLQFVLVYKFVEW